MNGLNTTNPNNYQYKTKYLEDPHFGRIKDGEVGESTNYFIS